MPEIKKTYTGEGANKHAVIQIDENVVGLNQFNLLNDLITKEVNYGIKSFVFDMTSLESINSSGLGILIASLKNIKNSNCSLKIINASPKILKIFKLTKLDNVFEFSH